MRVVLDTSTTITWCIPDQATPAAEALLKHVKLEGALVPFIWRLEVANILGLKLRDGNLSEVQVRKALGLLKSLDIATDTQRALSIAKCINDVSRFNLAVYDALYVELALRTGLPLATFDKAMIASARRHGITLLGTA